MLARATGAADDAIAVAVAAAGRVVRVAPAGSRDVLLLVLVLVVMLVVVVVVVVGGSKVR